MVALHGTLLESRNNAAAKQRSAVEALATLVTNVLDAPGEPKFRKLRCGNEALKARLFCAKGAEDFLKAAGWRERTLEYQRHLVLEDGFDAECVCSHTAPPLLPSPPLSLLSSPPLSLSRRRC